MSDDDDLAALLGDAMDQQAPTATGTTGATGDDDGALLESSKSKKDKKKDKKALKKEHKKALKKKSGRRRQRDEPTSSEEDVDEGDLMDWDNIADDDESSDDDQDKKKPKKSKSKFVRDAASEGDEDDDEADSMMGAGSDEELDVEDEYTRMMDAQMKKRRAAGAGGILAAALGGDEEADTDAIAREYEERRRADRQAKKSGKRLGAGAVVGEDADEDEGFEAREIEDDTTQFSAAFLPRPDDAKVYAVRVRAAYAKLLVARLVNKCHMYLEGNNTERVRQDLGILSVFSLPHVNDFIYVESHRQKFVESALAGLDGCFRYRITELTTDAVMQLFTAPVVSQLGSAVQKGELVRVRTALYRYDLVEIMEVLEDGKRALCRLIPRIDFVGKAWAPSKSGGGAFGKVAKSSQDAHAAAAAAAAAASASAPDSANSTRPPPRLFVPTLTLGATTRGDYGSTWGPETFDKHGFLLREFTIRQLFCGPAKGTVPDPTPEELHRLFEHDPQQLQQRLMSAKPADAPLGYHPGTRIVYFSERFCVGDPIRIVKGQLAGVTGRIVELTPSEGRAVISVVVQQQQQQQQQQFGMMGPQAPATTTLTVDLSEACKLFAVGDQIAVERGPHQGETGVVLTSSGVHITFYSDTGKGHCTAEANDCSAATAAAARPDRVGAWKLFDLVELVDNRTVGVIVSLGRDSVEILTEANAATRVPLASIKHKVAQGRASGQRNPTDVFGNQIVPSQSLAVEVMRSNGGGGGGAPIMFAGRTCSVKAVYEDTVFVRSDAVREHAGIGAVHCKVVHVLSGRNKPLDASSAAAQADAMLLLHESQRRQRALPKPAPPKVSPVPDLYNTLNFTNSGGGGGGRGGSTASSAAYTTAYDQ